MYKRTKTTGTSAVDSSKVRKFELQVVGNKNASTRSRKSSAYDRYSVEEILADRKGAIAFKSKPEAIQCAAIFGASFITLFGSLILAAFIG